MSVISPSNSGHATNEATTTSWKVGCIWGLVWNYDGQELANIDLRSGSVKFGGVDIYADIKGLLEVG